MISVLVVDDDFRVARINAAFTDRVEGFHVVGFATSGAETMATARRLSPDLILLDLYLPDVFGLDLIGRLRVAHVASDIVVISAANESQTVERALKLGAVDYLLKPFHQGDLAARLTDYRARRRVRWPDTVRGQGQIDQIFGRSETLELGPLPKGMSPETAQLVLTAVDQSEHALSAQECADAIGVSRVSARRYLEHFVQAGQMNVTLRYGTRGRPERRYQLHRGPSAPGR